MAKEKDLYDTFIETLLVIARNPDLSRLLRPIPKEYKPQQLDSLLAILKKQEANTNLFKKFS